jgi:hypothetical protein
MLRALYRIVSPVTAFPFLLDALPKFLFNLLMAKGIAEQR